MVDRTHFWVSIPDPGFVFELIKLDAHYPPEDIWAVAFLQMLSLKDGTLEEEIEVVFDLPFRPEMLEQLDQWLVRVKEAVKEAMNDRV